MNRAQEKVMSSTWDTGSLVGGNILNLVTTAMYNDPLAIYREYIQNAADEFAASGFSKGGKVEIEIDPVDSLVRIRDNGSGLSSRRAVRALVPVAQSEKKQGNYRGFRGIGRLAGLAFADSVAFTTRSRPGEPVTRIIWNGPELRRCIAENMETEQAIRKCVTIETLPGSERPAHFFEVEVGGIGRHAAGLILNREVVRGYVGEVCPVPFGPHFPFASAVQDILPEDAAPLALDVRLDGEPLPITRPFGATIRFPNGKEDNFTRFEKIDVPAPDGIGSAAIGWLAHSSYQGVIPKESRIRGIRVRVGNIQIGDEANFDHLFAEERFNRWCVGELHILDSRIIPNGRRDRFEPGPHVRNLENHVGALARQITSRCREASARRNRNNRLHAVAHELEDMYELIQSGYLSPEGARILAESTMERVQRIRRDEELQEAYAGESLRKMEALEQRLGSFRAKRGRSPFRGISKLEVATYRKVFQTLAEVAPSPGVAKELMEAVLSRCLEWVPERNHTRVAVRTGRQAPKIASSAKGLGL